MKYNKINDFLKLINSKAKKKRKKTCFLIGTTKKKFSNNFYLTPYRESQKTIYMGAIVNSNKTAKDIAKKIDGHVNYVFVDIEKKISSKLDILTNIERATKETINKSIIKNYKPNDITVNSIENFIQDYFKKDLRGVGGKKILIVGAGNIGSKIALRLLESGGLVNLLRRSKKKLKIINNALNIIKPSYTEAKSSIIYKDQLKLESYDIIIGCTDREVKFKKINNFKKHPMIIDVGQGMFSKNYIKQLSSKKVPVFRLDVESSLSSFIDSKISTENFFNSSFINKRGKFRLIKKGILGNSGDIIVDNVAAPRRIIGICGNEGLLKNLTIKQYNLLKRKILKNGKK